MLGTRSWRAAVRFWQVDGQAEVDHARVDDRRLAVLQRVAAVHRRDLGEGLDDRVADQVGERDLAAARARQVVVDDDPVVDHELGWHGPHRRRRRYLEAGLHVRHHARGRTPQPLDDGLRAAVVLQAGGRRVGVSGGGGRRRRDRAGQRGRRSGSRGVRGTAWPDGPLDARLRLRRGGGALGALAGPRPAAGSRRAVSTGAAAPSSATRVPVGRLGSRQLRPRPVVLEEVPPGRVDRVAVGEELLVELVHEPLVRAEGRS